MSYGSIISFIWCVVAVFFAVIVLIFLCNVLESVVSAKIDDIKSRKQKRKILDTYVKTVEEQIKNSFNDKMGE